MDLLFDDDELVLDYSEDDDFAPPPVIRARSQAPDKHVNNDQEAGKEKGFALHSEFKVAAGNTIPFADSHLHVDESLRFTLDNWTTSDTLENGIYELSAYVAVFCRPKAYMHDHNRSGSETMAQASRNDSLPQNLCLGATIGTHPGSAHEWSADVSARITELVKKSTHEEYRIVGLGEAGLDLTKSAPSRDRKGRRQNPRDPDAIFDHQLPAFREQIQLAMKLRNELGNPLPLVLRLREAKADANKVWSRALLTLRTENLDKDHPIHCHFFEGGFQEYQDWIQFFPRTMFSINAKSLTKHLSSSQLNFLSKVPLTRVTFESDMPHCSITPTPYSTPANVVEAARKFQYYGRRRQSLPDILHQALVNTVTFYRPDTNVVRLQDRQSYATTKTDKQPDSQTERRNAGASTDPPVLPVEITEPRNSSSWTHFLRNVRLPPRTLTSSTKLQTKTLRRLRH